MKIARTAAHSAYRPSNATGTPVKGVPVPTIFWPAFAIVNLAVAGGLRLTSETQLSLAAALMLIGGLPHGAFDIALARQEFRLSRHRAVVLVCAYVGVAALMVLLWATLPLVALCLFLAISAAHFGEDWRVLEPGLLRAMAGASVLCIAAFASPDEVSHLFVLMAGKGADWVCKVLVAFTPVALLVTSVGMWQAVTAGSRGWALAQLSTLTAFVYLPPQIGFLLFFVFLHSPLHFIKINGRLTSWSRADLWIYGAAICSICVFGALVLTPRFFFGDADQMASEGFKILSVVAAPHLLLTYFVEIRQKTNRHSRIGRSSEELEACTNVS